MNDLLRIPVDRALEDRLRWLIGLRWATLASALLLVLLANSWLGNVLPVGALWGVLVAVGAYNAAFYLLARRLTAREMGREVYLLLMRAQILSDLVALTVMLHLSGGLENPFSVYYVLVVAVGSILATTRDGYVFAGVASLLWVGLLVAEATGIVPHHNLVGFRLPGRYQELGHIIAEGFVLVSANYAVAYFSTNLIARLREGETQLYDANAACEVRAEQLEELNQRLQQLDHQRALFIRLVTHELRAPVAAIKSFLRLILDGYVPPEKHLEVIAKSEQRAGEQLDLIGDLLELARIQEPHESACELVNVAGLLGDVLDIHQAGIQDSGLTLATEVQAGDPLVWADRDQIRQVWMNMISNATKYTQPGGRVTVRLTHDGTWVRGAVSDTGIGIRPEELERIFVAFYRTDEAKEIAHHGTGLGLSIVQGVVERFGGRVDVTSEFGVGSTFTFELPQAQPDARVATHASKPSAGAL